MATLRGESVDRPAVNFYEIGGFKFDRSNSDPFYIYNDPSWAPLIQLAEEETDIIRIVTPRKRTALSNPSSELFASECYEKDGSRYFRTTLKVGNRTLTSLARRDPDIDTNWFIEHLLKDVDDLKAYLELPDEIFDYELDISHMFEEEKILGDAGIVMVDTPDPLCMAASLFSMEDYLVIALTEQNLFHQLLEKFARYLYPVTEYVAREFPGRHWRIYGPEYATEPYLPPRLFREYVVNYTKPMVDIINKYGGYPRIHCHGRVKNVLPYIVEMGVVAIEPLEPPPQGDVELDWVRCEYGQDLVLMGNIEVSDIENLEPAEFEKVVIKSLRDGTSGKGKGFVLMPTACPYSRKIRPRTMANYETMVRLAKQWSNSCGTC
jgi:hypothetical protein